MCQVAGDVGDLTSFWNWAMSSGDGQSTPRSSTLHGSPSFMKGRLRGTVHTDRRSPWMIRFTLLR